MEESHVDTGDQVLEGMNNRLQNLVFPDTRDRVDHVIKSLYEKAVYYEKLVSTPQFHLQLESYLLLCSQLLCFQPLPLTVMPRTTMLETASSVAPTAIVPHLLCHQPLCHELWCNQPLCHQGLCHQHHPIMHQ